MASVNMAITRVYLIPWWRGYGYGYTYSVTLAGQTIVQDSRDPETDLARALLDLGITGIADVWCGKTNKPRCIVNIERLQSYALWKQRMDPAL